MAEKSKKSFSGFVLSKVEELRASGRDGTADTYLSLHRSLLRFRGGKDLCFNEFSRHEVERYESWLLRCGVMKNTASFYMRTLRTVFRLAEREGMAVGNSTLFADVYTGFPKTAKRAVSMSSICRIKALDLNGRPALAFARDLFLFSFYMRGMPFVDVAYLRKSDLHDGAVRYVRRKTGQALIVEWEPQMQEIVDRYASLAAGSEYLLPVLTRKDVPERVQYKCAQRSVNRNLKTVAELLGLDTSLSFYVARHSWASSAYKMDIPMSVISESMGHESERTTRIYLASLDRSAVGRANRRILKCVIP